MAGKDDLGDASMTYGLLAKALGITVTTVKSYRRKFPEFWRAESQGKPIRFPARTLDLCRAVQKHFRRGLSVAETRKRLSEEFETLGEPGSPQATPASPESLSAHAAQVGSNPVGVALAPEHLARMEALLEGLFSLQNRTHSLMAELVAKLDTVADRLGPGASVSVQAAASARLGAGGVSDPGEVRPPAVMLNMPVVVRSGDGDYLGVTSRSGKPFTLGQFEAFLVRRAQDVGPAGARWLPDGQDWTLRLDNQGQTHDHHFLKAQTPRGNVVARFASLSVGGEAVSEAALQAFLRQVKETIDQ
jgi:hypothetical protein